MFEGHKRMEFNYKRRKVYLYIALLVLGMFGLLQLVYGLYNHLTLEPRGILASLILLTSGGFGTLFYLKNITGSILVDEEGIKQRTKNPKNISWEKIEKVEFLEDNPYFFSSLYLLFGKSIFVLNVKSERQQITIGSEIENISELIMCLKNKLGDRFNTTEIPLEYKKARK